MEKLHQLCPNAQALDFSQRARGARQNYCSIKLNIFVILFILKQVGIVPSTGTLPITTSKVPGFKG